LSAINRDIENALASLEITASNDLNVGAQLDAGGRLRVSQLNTQLDIKQTNDDQPLFYQRLNIGAASQTYSKDLGATTMSVSGNGDAAIAQSYQWATYFSGKSQFGEITFNDFANQTNVTKRAGYFSGNAISPYDNRKDGLWFEADGTDYRIKIQKDGTDILNVDQSSWNIDTATWLDPSKFNVFVFQFLYLGGTAVKFGFINEGFISWVHEYQHAGIIASTFIESPNQPIRYEIRSSGGAGSMDQVCAQISSEGSFGEVGVPVNILINDFQANSSAETYVVLAWDLKQSYRNISTEVDRISLLSETNDDFRWILCLDPTYNGSITFNDIDNSALRRGAGATANTVTDFGYILDQGFVQANSDEQFNIRNKLNLGSKIDQSSQVMALLVSPLSNGLDIFANVSITQYL